MVRVSGKTDVDERLKRLGSTVRQHRKSLGLSQEALADAAQIDRSHMGKIERGERNLTMLNLLRIAEAVRRSASELLGDARL